MLRTRIMPCFRLTSSCRSQRSLGQLRYLRPKHRRLFEIRKQTQRTERPSHRHPLHL